MFRKLRNDFCRTPCGRSHYHFDLDILDIFNLSMIGIAALNIMEFMIP